MLEDHKKLFEQRADRVVPGWRRANKNDLINKYIENEHTNKELADGYMSAIMCRYWGAISRYYATSHNSVTVETCYDWLVRSILYAIQRRPWLVEGSNLYGDPTGPDKTVNQVIKSTRLGFYQSSNTHKRKCNFGNTSLDAMVEELGEAAPLPEEDSCRDTPMSMDIQNFIQDAFKNKEYLLAFMVDGIINYEVFDHEIGSDGYTYSQFSPKRLARHVRSLSPNYCERFAQMYHLNEPDTEKAAESIKEISRLRLKTMMKRNMKLLGKTKALCLED